MKKMIYSSILVMSLCLLVGCAMMNTPHTMVAPQNRDRTSDVIYANLWTPPVTQEASKPHA